MADRYQVRQTKTPLSMRSTYHTTNPNPGGDGSGGQDGSPPKKSLEELSSEVSLDRTRCHDYPDNIHLSIRKKYSPDTVHHALKVYEADDPLPVLQRRGIQQDRVLECLSYLKLIHGDDLSGK